MNKKTQNKTLPHEKPISIPLEFEDAIEKILSAPPKNKLKPEKSDNK